MGRDGFTHSFMSRSGNTQDGLKIRGLAQRLSGLKTQAELEVLAPLLTAFRALN